MPQTWCCTAPGQEMLYIHLEAGGLLAKHLIRPNRLLAHGSIGVGDTLKNYHDLATVGQ